jgi:DNA helicase II / ATP-dependent DNA helicase PcrA
MTTDHDAELQMERGTNERYLREFRRHEDSMRRGVESHTATARNARWVGKSVTSGLLGHHLEPLIGRVALTEADPDLGVNFYIGSGYLDTGDMVVVRWVAPMAQLFYVGEQADVDVVDSLAGRRTFSKEGDDITDFEDVLEPGLQDSPFASPHLIRSGDAPKSTDQSVGDEPPIAIPPSPPTRPQRPLPILNPSKPFSAADASSADTEDAISSRPTTDALLPIVATTTPETAEENESDVSVGTGRQESLTQLRAPKTVLAALAAPRTGRLNSLLRTLQPQQYELITWPEEDHIVIQGHPGTGKTVIGLHRAAYLTDPDRLEPGQRVPKGEVLVLGPTAAYLEHVKPVLNELAPRDCVAWSLSNFYAYLGNYSDPQLPTESDHISTSSNPLGHVVLCVAEQYRGPRTAKDFTDHLFRVGEDVLQFSTDPDVLSFLRAGKNHEFARTQSRFHPVIALCGLIVTDVGLADRFRHIIVDEAQDLRPIDLQMLRLLVSHGVNLTLLGDMNQRRSDYTHASWAEVVTDLAIGRDDGSPPLTEISLGYRSTNQILRYAAGLLPRGERTAAALRDGPEPTTRSCRSASDLFAIAREEAVALQESTTGLVAILTMRPKDMSDHLRRKGWSRGHRMHSWRPSSDSSELLVLHPDLARGLEFDGVVVVEPTEFPALLGRHGVLYTSLTRATKQLSVVHSAALPRGLRRNRR